MRLGKDWRTHLEFPLMGGIYFLAWYLFLKINPCACASLVSAWLFFFPQGVPVSSNVFKHPISTLGPPEGQQ